MMKTCKETNYHMLRSLLKTFKPKTCGILSNEEVKQIKTALSIDSRDLLSLQNLRDFTVLYISHLMDDDKESDERIQLHDILSGITAVIDQAKFSLGGEV